MIELIGTLVLGVTLGVLAMVVGGACTIALYKAVVSLADVDDVDWATSGFVEDFDLQYRRYDTPWGNLLRDGVRGNPVSKSDVVAMIVTGPFGLLGMIYSAGWVVFSVVGDFVGNALGHAVENISKLAAQIGTTIARNLGVKLEEDAPAAALPPVTIPDELRIRPDPLNVGWPNHVHVFADPELTLKAANDVLNAVPRDITQTPPCTPPCYCPICEERVKKNSTALSNIAG